MKLTVGRIVIYRVGENDSAELKSNHAKFLPAVVVKVWTDHYANLKIFTDGPVDVWKTSVFQGEDEHQWRWPGDYEAKDPATA